MFNNIKKYFDIKRKKKFNECAEIEIKYTFYTNLEKMINDKEELKNGLNSLYSAIKSNDIDKFQHLLADSMAKIVHDSKEKERMVEFENKCKAEYEKKLAEAIHNLNMLK